MYNPEEVTEDNGSIASRLSRLAEEISRTDESALVHIVAGFIQDGQAREAINRLKGIRSRK